MAVMLWHNQISYYTGKSIYRTAETMNVSGNYRYATAGADKEMAAWAAWQVGCCC